MIEAVLARLTPARIFILLALIAAVLYYPTVYHDFIDIDDPGFILRNGLVQNVSPATILRAFTSTTMLLYVPVTIVSYQINALFGSTDASIYHFTDLVLHAINAMLVAAVILRMTKSKLAGLLCALLFTVHPIHTEAVLWASSRKDLLSTTFALSSLLLYVRFLEHRWVRDRNWSLVLYALGLLSKIAIFPLPVLFLLLDWIYDARIDLRGKIPHAIIAIPLLVIGVYSGNQFALALNPLETLLLGVKSTTFLFSQLFWPSRQSALHLEYSSLSIGDPVFLISLAVFFGLLIAAVILWRKRVHLPAWGIFFFVLMLLPTFAAAQKGGMLFFTSDKYAYLPSIGLLISIAAWMRVLEQHWKAALLPLAIIVVFISSLLMLRTRYLIPHWTNARTLLESVLARDPGNPVALSNRGLQIQESDPEGALWDFQNAIASDPHYAIPYFNGAALLRKNGREQEAIVMYEAMIPNLTEREVLGDRTLQSALQWLVGRFEQLGRPDLSHRLWERLDQIDPRLLHLDRAA